MKKERLETEIKVGFFVIIGIGLSMLSILLIGGPSLFFSSQSKYHAFFSNSVGLISGSKVVLDGIQVGIVKQVALDPGKRKVKITFLIQTEFHEWLYKETIAEILTQGVLGDKYIALNNEGAKATEPLPPGSEIQSAEGGGLSKMISGSGQLITHLNKITDSLTRILKHFEDNRRDEIFFSSLSKTTKNLASITENLDTQLSNLKFNSAVNHLNSILQKMDQGKGTVGALLNDPALYDDAKALIGQANRNRVVRNLVRQTITEADQSSVKKISVPAGKKPTSSQPE